MSRKNWLFLGLLIGGCGGPAVHQDYDPKQDFTNFKTWSWAPQTPRVDGSSDPLATSSLTRERVHQAVEREMTMRGFQHVDATNADFWVQQYAIVEQSAVVEPGYDWGHEDVSTYEKGTIIVDVITPKNRRMVWRGTASGAVEPDLKPTEREERIQEAVHEILAQFPPKK